MKTEIQVSSTNNPVGSNGEWTTTATISLLMPSGQVGNQLPAVDVSAIIDTTTNAVFLSQAELLIAQPTSLGVMPTASQLAVVDQMGPFGDAPLRGEDSVACLHYRGFAGYACVKMRGLGGVAGAIGNRNPNNNNVVVTIAWTIMSPGG